MPLCAQKQGLKSQWQACCDIDKGSQADIHSDKTMIMILLLYRGRGLFYRWQLQSYAKLISLLKVILVALLLNGISSGTSLAQVSSFTPFTAV